MLHPNPPPANRLEAVRDAVHPAGLAPVVAAARPVAPSGALAPTTIGMAGFRDMPRVHVDRAVALLLAGLDRAPADPAPRSTPSA
jgi:hypothetical protein